MFPGKVDWEAYDSTLRALWRAGKSAEQIAREIPAATRNAVIGRLARTGLTRDDKPKPPVKVSRPTSVRRSAKEPLRKPVHPKPVSVTGEAQRQARMAEAEAALPKRFACFAVSAGTAPIGLMDLRTGTCRWPYDSAEGAVYCGARVVRGAFCSTHGPLAYTRPETPEERRIAAELRAVSRRGRTVAA